MNVPVFLLFLTLKERLAIRLQKQISRTNIEYCLVKFCVSNIGQSLLTDRLTDITMIRKAHLNILYNVFTTQYMCFWYRYGFPLFL